MPEDRQIAQLKSENETNAKKKIEKYILIDNQEKYAMNFSCSNASAAVSSTFRNLSLQY